MLHGHTRGQSNVLLLFIGCLTLFCDSLIDSTEIGLKTDADSDYDEEC